jgi:hypothetical protein
MEAMQYKDGKPREVPDDLKWFKELCIRADLMTEIALDELSHGNVGVFKQQDMAPVAAVILDFLLKNR